MKKNKGIIILAAFLIVLILAYLVLTMNNDNNSVNEPEDTEIYYFSTENITKIKITSAKETYSLLYGDNVLIPELPGSYVDEEKANVFRRGMSIITTSEIVSDNSDDASEFGLDNPLYTVELFSDDEIIKTVDVGIKSPVGNGYYCRIKGEDRIFILPDFKYENLSRPSSYYRTMTFFEIDKNNISEITIDVYGKHVISLKENVVDDINTPHNVFYKYRMTSPFDWPASSDIVEKIFDSLINIEVVEYAAENSKNMADFGFAPYVSKINVVHDNGISDTIYFGNTKEGIVYIRTNKDDKIYGISAEPFSYFQIEPFSFLSNLAFLRNVMTVKHINYNYEDITADFVLTPVDEENFDVKIDGKAISQKEFTSIYTELISLSIAGVYDGAFPSNRFLSYTFDYNDLSQEKIEFYKVDDRRAAFAINGKCQFYVNMVELKEKIKKINEIIESY